MKIIEYLDDFKYATANLWPKQVEKDENFFIWFVAQAMAESSLNPHAVSRVGACGLMQIMPKTWHDIRLYLPYLNEDIFDPASNIEGGIWYVRWCFDRFQFVRDFNDRFKIALSSYNCGPSRIRRLLEPFDNPTYLALEPQLPRETSFYIERIVKFHDVLLNNIKLEIENEISPEAGSRPSERHSAQ